MKNEENEIIAPNKLHNSLELNTNNKSSFEKAKSTRFLIIQTRNLSIKEKQNFSNRANTKYSNNDIVKNSKIKKISLKKMKSFLK